MTTWGSLLRIPARLSSYHPVCRVSVLFLSSGIKLYRCLGQMITNETLQNSTDKPEFSAAAAVFVQRSLAVVARVRRRCWMKDIPSGCELVKAGLADSCLNVWNQDNMWFLWEHQFLGGVEGSAGCGAGTLTTLSVKTELDNQMTSLRRLLCLRPQHTPRRSCWRLGPDRGVNLTDLPL